MTPPTSIRTDLGEEGRTTETLPPTQDPMRVCMVTPIIVPSRAGAFSGGHVNSLLRFVDRLTRAGHEVHVLAGIPEEAVVGAEGVHDRVPNAHLVPVTREPHTPGYGIEFVSRANAALKRLHASTTFDLVHLHTGYPVYGILKSWSVWNRRLPYIMTLYCPVSNTAADRSRLLLSSTVSRAALSRIDRVIAISENIRRSLVGTGVGEERIEVVPPPVDLSRFNPLVDTTPVGIEGDPFVLFVGNYSKTKALDVLIRAMPEVLKHFPSATLVLALDAESKLTRAERARKEHIDGLIDSLGLAPRIVRLGLVENLEQLMARADVMVAPFRSTEGPADYPLSVLEAMATGCPVISTMAGGIPEVITDGETGLLVEPADVHSLQRALILVLEDRKLGERLGTAAARSVHQRFGLDATGAAVEEVYRNVLEPQSQHDRDRR